MLRESWRNRAGFALAAMGSAIGLASIVRFPYLVADHGGAAFIAVYLLSLFVIGIPILISEITLGRATQKNCYESFADKGQSSFWKGAGAWILLTALLVSAFYSALSGWICGYLVEAIFDQLQPLHTTELATVHFKELLRTPLWGLSYHFIFLGVSVVLVYAGLRKGIERGCKILMPILFLMLLILVVKGLSLDNSLSALEYLFKPDWNLITPSVILMASGQAFFTLSLGQGTMITYGSYLPKNSPFVGSCIAIALSVVVVSILSAIAVFTIIFSANMTPEGGLGLMFQTLPVVFSNMVGGHVLAISFFLLVALAALTSEISVLEPIIAYLVDKHDWTRKNAALVAGAMAFVIGVPCALSTSLLADWHLGSKNILELFDLVATTILVPLGGLLGVLLVTWRWGFAPAFKELTNGKMEKYPVSYLYLKVCLKYLAPALILIIFFSNLSLFQQ
ncbi:MAG: sodium-dependent transporter [Parachlamydia sp.]|jgi:NSS family neurotransmitter:Na+ symporter|nr:sodium-dependent transporter [Parachlamydia sp.]